MVIQALCYHCKNKTQQFTSHRLGTIASKRIRVCLAGYTLSGDVREWGPGFPCTPLLPWTQNKAQLPANSWGALVTRPRGSVLSLLQQKASAGLLFNGRLSLPATSDTWSLSTSKCIQNPSKTLSKPSRINQSSLSSSQRLSLSDVKFLLQLRDHHSQASAHVPVQ